jgi:ribose 5-phosphate isomerase B|tara:strand:+ start:260 stop:745 length:486 start_codon:yes stop_codon:yes gene_type:complete
VQRYSQINAYELQGVVLTGVAIGSDHAGYSLKCLILAHLQQAGFKVEDFGTFSDDRVDYPDYGALVGRAVADGEFSSGIVVCGSGIGIVMAAGKIPGIRAATIHDTTSARLAREHNDANVIGLGARLVGEQTALDAVDAYLRAVFLGGRHADRVKKLNLLD